MVGSNDRGYDSKDGKQENPEEMRGFLIYQSLEGREVYPDSEAYWEVIFPVTLENKASSNSSFEL